MAHLALAIKILKTNKRSSLFRQGANGEVKKDLQVLHKGLVLYAFFTAVIVAAVHVSQRLVSEHFPP